MANDEPTKTNAPRTNGVSRVTSPYPAEAIKLLLYLQNAYPHEFRKEFAVFEKELEESGVPWSLADAAFLTKLKQLEARLKKFYDAGGVEQATIDSAVPKGIVSSLVAELESLPTKKEAITREFIHNLTDAYVTNLKKQMRLADESGLQDAARKSLEKAVGEASSAQDLAEEIPRRLAEAFSQSQQEGSVAERRLSEEVAQQAAQEHAGVLSLVVNPSPNEEEVVKRTLANARVGTNKEGLARYMDCYARENPRVSLDTIEAQAEKLALVEEALSSVVRVGDEVTLVSRLPQDQPLFVGRLVERPKSPTQQAAQAKETFSRVWSEATSDKALEASLGSPVSSGPIVKTAVFLGNRAFPQKPEAAAAPGPSRPVFRPGFIRAAETATHQYIELARVQENLARVNEPRQSGLGSVAPVAGAPSPKNVFARLSQHPPTLVSAGVSYVVFGPPQFYLAASHAGAPGAQYEFLPGVGMRLVAAAAEGGLSVGMGGVASKLAGAGAKAGAARIAGPALAGVGAALAGPLGTVAGWVGGELLTRAAGRALSIGRRIFSFFINPLSGVAGEDMWGMGGWLFPIALVLLALLFLVFPSVFIEMGRSAAFPTSSEVTRLGGYRHPAGSATTYDVATGSGPLPGGELKTGSLSGGAGHGSSSYWGNEPPTYPIPIEAMAHNCMDPVSCPYYGFACDVAPQTRGGRVVVPTVCPAETSGCREEEWLVTNRWYNCAGNSAASAADCTGERWGYGIILETRAGGRSIKTYLNHVEPSVSIAKNQTRLRPGDAIGTVNTTVNHVHVELNVDGVPTRPDFLCRS